MKEFKKFYVFGMNAKFYMGLYFTAILFLTGIISVFMGADSISFLSLIEMLLVAMVIGFAQEGLLGNKYDYTKTIFFFRSILWLIGSALLTMIASFVCDWFEELPRICNLILGGFMVIGLIATLMGLRFEQEMATTKLNDDLENYKKNV